MRRMYSENQLENIIQKEIASGENIVNGAWEYEQDIELEDSFLNGLEVANLFGKIQVKNGVLYIVISALLSNNTESSITTGSTYIAYIKNIPSKIASKIFRKDGSNIDNAPIGSVWNILNKKGYNTTDTGGSPGDVNINVNSNFAKQIELYARNTFSVASGSAKAFDFRVFITL